MKNENKSIAFSVYLISITPSRAFIDDFPPRALSPEYEF
jgi:hypothetical protein